VLEDFDLRCAAASYVAVSAIFYNQDKVAVETLFEPSTAAVEDGSI